MEGKLQEQTLKSCPRKAISWAEYNDSGDWPFAGRKEKGIAFRLQVWIKGRCSTVLIVSISDVRVSRVHDTTFRVLSNIFQTQG